jgi:Lon protease-like protein
MDSDDALALFPLSNVVLFPKVQTPLHVFEPRYRQLAEQVLAGSRRIGMVVVPPEHAAAMADDPPVYPIGCAGLISQSHRLPDGRYNIVLVGTERFRITNEPPRPAGRLYRTAEVEPLQDPFPPAGRARVAELRDRIVELVAELVHRTDPERAAQVSSDLFRGVDDVTFVNSLCNALFFQPQEKQGLLEAADIPERFDRLEGLLSFRLAALDGIGAPPSSRVH